MHDSNPTAAFSPPGANPFRPDPQSRVPWPGSGTAIDLPNPAIHRMRLEMGILDQNRITEFVGSIVPILQFLAGSLQYWITCECAKQIIMTRTGLVRPG